MFHIHIVIYIYLHKHIYLHGVNRHMPQKKQIFAFLNSPHLEEFTLDQLGSKKNCFSDATKWPDSHVSVPRQRLCLVHCDLVPTHCLHLRENLLPTHCLHPHENLLPTHCSHLQENLAPTHCLHLQKHLPNCEENRAQSLQR